MVKLGYAISIHKSQGGGFKTVILCTPQSHIFMLNSNLLYVGLTRMKEKLYHLGSLQSVNQAVKKKANLTRNTFMQKLLKNSQNLLTNAQI
jgi:exodeoxyribonuclease V alpha subunit